MEGKNSRHELAILLKDIKEMLRLKNLFRHHLEGSSYELCPRVNFFAIKLPFHSFALYKFYWLMIYLNTLSILIEQTWSVFTEKSTILKIRNIMFRYFHVYGLICATTLMTNRDRIISEIRKMKTLQWSLHWLDPKVKAAIERRGLNQSFVTELCLVLTMIYAALVGKLLRNSFLMNLVKSFNQPFFERLFYFFEFFNFMFCVFFAAIIPHVYIYFATEAEVQTRLLAAYVSKLAHIFYTDNEALITSVGLKYAIPGIFSFTCNLFEYLQNDVNKLICGMNTSFLVIIAVFTLFCGQSYEDEWRNYYREICKLPWYIWSVAYRKTYLLILMGSSRTTKIRLINHISVNYNLLKQIFKYLYTSANTARNIYNKKVDSRSSIS